MELEPERHAAHRFCCQVHAAPACSPAYQLLRFRALPEADLKHPLAPYVEIIEAAGNVAFQSIAVLVVRVEEGRVVAAKLLVQAAQQVVTAGVRLPEALDVGLWNDFHRRQLRPRSPLSHNVPDLQASAGPQSGCLLTLDVPKRMRKPYVIHERVWPK